MLSDEAKNADPQNETQIAALGCDQETKKPSEAIVNTVLFSDKEGSQHFIIGFCYRDPNSPKGVP